MEKSKIIGYCLGFFLGLVVIVMTPIASLGAKEIFDIPFHCSYRDFDYRTVQTASFVFYGDKELDIDAIIKSIARDKAEVVIAGKPSIEGAAWSPSLTTFVSIDRNVEEKSWLVTINTFVHGVATKALGCDGEPFRGIISLSARVLAFVDSEERNEVEKAITVHLQDLADKITGTTNKKPKFFVVH